jgi:hypothetical protein
LRDFNRCNMCINHTVVEYLQIHCSPQISPTSVGIK